MIESLKSWFVFQLTHSRGVRHWMPLHGHWAATFQLTHSRGVRPLLRMLPRQVQDFNSRTHVECDRGMNSIRNISKISTHALTWSATLGIIFGCTKLNISTHALTWSATMLMAFMFRVKIFQLTHSRGVRPPQSSFIISQNDFNSRTHVECDTVGA